MSPRKNNVLMVKGWPDPRKGKLYKGAVKKAVNKAKSLHITIENLDSSQLGRMHDVNLPLPVRPGNRTCSFFAACGIDTRAVGTKVCLDDIAGVTIGMRFGMIAQDGSQEVDFERIEDSSSKQPETLVQNSADQSGQ